MPGQRWAQPQDGGSFCKRDLQPSPTGEKDGHPGELLHPKVLRSCQCGLWAGCSPRLVIPALLRCKPVGGSVSDSLGESPSLPCENWELCQVAGGKPGERGSIMICGVHWEPPAPSPLQGSQMTHDNRYTRFPYIAWGFRGLAKRRVRLHGHLCGLCLLSACTCSGWSRRSHISGQAGLAANPSCTFPGLGKPLSASEPQFPRLQAGDERTSAQSI